MNESDHLVQTSACTLELLLIELCAFPDRLNLPLHASPALIHAFGRHNALIGQYVESLTLLLQVARGPCFKIETDNATLILDLSDVEAAASIKFMQRIAIVGGGIAGLSAAHRLEREGYQPVVLEASGSVGGVIRSERTDGYLVEHGPNSIQAHSPLIERLIRELGLESRRVRASEAARTRYVVKDRHPEAVPLAPGALLASRLFGPSAKFRLLREPFIPRADGEKEESVADFIRRRLGSEFLDYGMNPFVGGVYAGDPEQLSIQYAFPRLYRMEQEHGSIIRGQISGGRSGAEGAAETHRMFSFLEGLDELPAALARTLPAIRTGCRVTEVDAVDSTWMINGDPFDTVIYAAPLHALSEIQFPGLRDQIGGEMSRLLRVSYAPLSIVALGYPVSEVGHSLNGFGMLVPEIEPFRILGTLFTSSIFPRRAPEGHVLLTSFVGGMRDPDLSARPTAELVDLVHEDLRRLLDIRTEPTFARHVYWDRSIPQYELGYGSVLNAIDRLEEAMPGWFMAGNYRGGVSVGESATSGDEAARRCVAYLRRT